MAQYQSPTAAARPATVGSHKAEKEMQQVALLKSLEYLYVEACYAKMALVATLIGAAIEAVNDELAALKGSSRAVAPSLTISIRNFTTNRLLTDEIDLDDDDFVDDEPK
jgi:hypothetical protein